jgi:hypothetical protein
MRSPGASTLFRAIPLFTRALRDVYVTASTHLSSRAFPSSILSPEPSLLSTPSTSPVLIPGVDLLNHKRGHPVSWIVSCQDPQETTDTVSIVAHPTSCADTAPLVQVFNNYGPKPNDELILGYGFSILDNPDDTLTLLIGGSATPQQWVVGRHAQHAEGLWSDVRCMIATGECDYEDDLDTAAVLSDMVQAKLDGIKTVADVRQSDAIRPAVRVMLEHYIAGRHPALSSVACLTSVQGKETFSRRSWNSWRRNGRRRSKLRGNKALILYLVMRMSSCFRMTCVPLHRPAHLGRVCIALGQLKFVETCKHVTLASRNGDLYNSANGNKALILYLVMRMISCFRMTCVSSRVDLRISAEFALP